MARKRTAPMPTEALGAEQVQNVPQMSTDPIARRRDSEMAMLDAHAQMEQMPMPKKIGVDEIRKASEILRQYKEGKAHLEAKIIEEEQYWKLRQRKNIVSKDKEDVPDYQPNTAWLWSCIQGRVADAMDAFPTCNFLARQEDDKAEAKKLSAIVPVILEQNDFEATYNDSVNYFFKHGAYANGIFWDAKKHNGLGDIAIKRVDLLNLFWESGVTDIQDSENVFLVELVSKRLLEQKYPQTVGHLNAKTQTLAQYLYDDRVKTDDKAIVVDWYYKTEYNGKQAVQFVKFVNDVVLYATENETTPPTDNVIDPVTGVPMIVPTGAPIAERGLYDHGLYPFEIAPLFPIEGNICGYGLIDIGRDTQNQIDVLNKAITDNAVVNATPRYFKRDNDSFNDADFLDLNKKIIPVKGNLEDAVLPMATQTLGATFIEVLNQKIEELKFITANQDVSLGMTPSGVTAGSAISALQEAQGKNSRNSNKALYRAFRGVIYQVVELIRQFYDIPRVFRIAPDVAGGDEQYVTFDNSGLKPQPQYVMGQDMGLRKPEFDIEVTAEKASPYKKMEQNELALNFYGQGFFNPEMADQALACLEMMDFNHKEEIMQRIQQNGTILQLLLQYQQIALHLAQQVGDPNLVEGLSQAVLQTAGQAVPDSMSEDVNLSESTEHPLQERARETARESTQPQ